MDPRIQKILDILGRNMEVVKGYLKKRSTTKEMIMLPFDFLI
jgi:hypothetical protein